ncbi:MAG TPA: hypothetical protein ENL05_01200, partial [Candidatus Moranbacteria bacterium]|nr:hypothetical protein [Candidatus Moranbacteria bacterium]
MLKKISNNLFYLFIFLLPWQTILIWREVFISKEKWQSETIGIYFTDIILISWVVLILSKKLRKVISNFPAYQTGRQFPISNQIQNLSSRNIRDLKSKTLADLQTKIPKLKFPISNQIQITNYLVPIIGFILWSFFSILWSPDKTLAFYFSLKLLLGAGLFFALQEIKINWRKFIVVFLLATVLQSALAIGQFTFQRSFSNKWLGMSNYESWQGGISVLENEGGRWLRAYGSFPHPNILGGYLALAFIVG